MKFLEGLLDFTKMLMQFFYRVGLAFGIVYILIRVCHMAETKPDIIDVLGIFCVSYRIFELIYPEWKD